MVPLPPISSISLYLFMTSTYGTFRRPAMVDCLGLSSYSMGNDCAERDATRRAGGRARMATLIERETTTREVHERNPGMPLDLGRVEDARVNRSAVERRAATLPARRTVKKEWQAAWLLRAISDIDLTTLAGDDTPGTVRRLCAKARRPLRDEILERLGASDLDLRVAAVCVYHNLVPVAVEALAGSAIPVAAGSTGFPAGPN